MSEILDCLCIYQDIGARANRWLSHNVNILNVTPSYYPATLWGGPIFFDYGLNNALSRIEGINIKVLTTDVASPKSSERLRADRINYTHYPNQEVIFTSRIAGESISYDLLRKLPSLIRWADVVRLSSTYSFPTIPTIFLCRLYAKPLIWTLHGAVLNAHMWPKAPRRCLKRVWEIISRRLILKDKTVIHALSELERNSAEIRISGVRAVVIPNGLDVRSAISDKEFLPEGKMRLMYLGRLAPVKGIENLLSAMSLLKDSNVSLSIYGGGDQAYIDSLHGLVGNLGLYGNVRFMGEVSGEDKINAFRKADICVVPSHTESFCIVVAEALSHNVPVIASRGTPWSDLETRGCGLWVDNTPHGIASAIKSLQSVSLADMGERGREWMLSEYSWDIVATRMLDLYNSFRN